MEELRDHRPYDVYPLTRGSGPRLFSDDAAPGKLSLEICESYENGVVYLNYANPA